MKNGKRSKTFRAWESDWKRLLRKSKWGVNRFLRLLNKMIGLEDRIFARPELETPFERKNSILGIRVFSGSARSSSGLALMAVLSWVSENPSLLKKETTESGFSGELNRTCLAADEADSGENPQASIRYETVKEFSEEELEKNLGDDIDGWNLRIYKSLEFGEAEMVCLPWRTALERR